MNGFEPRPLMALLDAAQDVVSAGHQIVLDRVELVRAEATDDARALADAVWLAAAAAAMVTLGWVLVAAGGLVALGRVLDPGLAGAIGLPHAAVGLAMGEWTLRRARRRELSPAGLGGHGCRCLSAS